jgi:hypothetical protein
MPAKAGWKHRVQAQGLALSLRPLTRLAQDEEPDRACGAAGNGGGLGKAAMTYLAKDLRFRRLGRLRTEQAELSPPKQAEPGIAAEAMGASEVERLNL